MKKLCLALLLSTPLMAVSEPPSSHLNEIPKGLNGSDFIHEQYGFLWEEIVAYDNVSMVDQHLMRIPYMTAEEGIHHLLIMLYVAVRERNKADVRRLMNEIEESAGEAYLWGE